VPRSCGSSCFGAALSPPRPLSALWPECYAHLSIASPSSVASTVPSHMALWAWRYTSQDDSGDTCVVGDCFSMPPSPCVERRQPNPLVMCGGGHDQRLVDGELLPVINRSNHGSVPG
jgi:hypothetical protein